ncbi:MAG TPA: PDZ domain-containing protein, partial [Desulfobacterales bacterium]|nr:PDZ domain-containing protein [Desulfobacterales bacterium]
VTSVKGRRVSSRETYHAIIRDFTAGDIIPVKVWRRGAGRAFQIPSQTFPDALAEDWAYKSLGIRVQALSATHRLRFRIPARDGVIVTQVRAGSYLDRIGARPGDVIRKINDLVVKTPADFKGAAIKCRHKESAVLLIQRGNQQYYVTVKIEA